MKLKKTLQRLLLGTSLLFGGTGLTKVIDFPITDFYQTPLQPYYDRAEDGDTIRFVKINGSGRYFGDLNANKDKDITIDTNWFAWIMNNPIEVSNGTLRMIHHPYLMNRQGNILNVTNDANLYLDSAHFGERSIGVNISSSGVIELKDCWATNGATINVERLISGGSLKIERTDFQNQRGGAIVFGEEQPNSNYTVQINNNSFYDVDTPFKFESELKTTTGLIANNVVTNYTTYAENPERARGIQIASNNYFNLPIEEIGLGNKDLSVFSESLGDIGNNYSFNPRFEDGENLAEDSPLIDRGIFINGLQYNGNAPDISKNESPYTRYIPEPSTLLLGLLGLASLRRRR